MKFERIALLTLLLTTISVAGLAIVGANDGTLTLSDDYMMSNEFVYMWGPSGSSLVAKTDIPGPGVQFNFTGLSGSGTAVGDNYPVSQLAGGAGDSIGGYGNFSAYSQYSVNFTNVGETNVTVNLLMNTGWVSDGEDTFWQGSWTLVEVGKSELVILNFSSAECYGAMNDPVVEWQHPDGTTGVIVRRLDEVSRIGFQVLGQSPGSIIASSEWTEGPPPPVGGGAESAVNTLAILAPWLILASAVLATIGLSAVYVKHRK